MKKEAYIDQVFRGYGEAFFGKTFMDKLTPAQVEEARCAAMQALHDLTIEFGKQDNGVVKELFCNYVFENFV